MVVIHVMENYMQPLFVVVQVVISFMSACYLYFYLFFSSIGGENKSEAPICVSNSSEI